eukprot:1328548-Amorphochlora_amoeboformis.AAC.2
MFANLPALPVAFLVAVSVRGEESCSVEGGTCRTYDPMGPLPSEFNLKPIDRVHHSQLSIFRSSLPTTQTEHHCKFVLFVFPISTSVPAAYAPIPAHLFSPLFSILAEMLYPFGDDLSHARSSLLQLCSWGTF